uniref:Protein translocase subunit SecA n=1 Tax=Spyridia filamentosa TaxID=196632 RepID=A0A1Z1MJB6_SPYFI|nr:preprotein-translocase subunit a [Spyridia filamentosa]ARW66148.1 preprotein-translocase subunit a [Spyridia filamentosa]
MINFLFQQPLKKHEKTIRLINKLSERLDDYSDAELEKQTEKFKEKINNGADLNTIMPEAFASVKIAIKRATGLILFDTQILGGIILHYGQIAEMKTGEGKTIAAMLSAYLNALNEKSVHIITVNEYLAKRDANLAKQIFNKLDISIGLIQSNTNDHINKKKEYECSIIYITNNELGFDYLRNNMSINQEEILKQDFHYAIIDEVDSILIDEARTPLIISGKAEKDSSKYLESQSISEQLEATIHYEIDEKTKNITLTERGIAACEKILQINNLYNLNNSWIKYILNSLKAKELFIKNKDYIIKENNIVIVDEFTGRIMEGRRWSDGLHQAIEAKERTEIQAENRTLASITYQNLFLLYNKLSGMTGTAKTEEQEFEKIYNLKVIEIPTHKSCQRQDLPDLVYKAEYNKWKSIAHECYDMYKIGRPTLVGTTSIEKSELLAKILIELKIPYNLLNARPENIAREAEIIAQAGRKYNITIATNMAGRGTDIVLGGNPVGISKKQLEELLKTIKYKKQEVLDPRNQQSIELDDIEVAGAILNKHKNSDIEKYVCKISEKYKFNENNNVINNIYEKILKENIIKCKKEKEDILRLGGLYIIGTERHESRRIDNQLRGRSGRQGDKGSSRFFLSLEDNLFRIFGGENISQLMQTLNMDANTPIESILLNKSLNSAQKKIEGYFYDIRKQLFEYDQVINNQRQAIYAERKRILESNCMRDSILEYGESTLEEILKIYVQENNIKNKNRIIIQISKLLNISENFTIEQLNRMTYMEIKNFFIEQLYISYDLRENYIEQLRPGLMRQLEKYYLLQQIDQGWQGHLEKMMILKESIGWRSYGQQDPLIEYKNEAFNLFINMVTHIRQTVTYLVMRSRLIVN